MKNLTLYLLSVIALLLSVACDRNDTKPMSIPERLRSIVLAACNRNDIRTEIFPIEQMRNPESVQLISKALQPLGGIMKITPNYGDHELIVVFDGKALYKKNIEYAIVNAGFSLPYWPASPTDKAKLPEDLR